MRNENLGASYGPRFGRERNAQLCQWSKQLPSPVFVRPIALELGEAIAQKGYRG
jgi:hypothetical protein